MNLNKDNRDIYTIDSESYSMYMKENREESRDSLGFIIQLLIVILLFVLVYFFFNILKNNLTFSEVFNKKELLTTYESLVDSDDEIKVVLEDEGEIVPKKAVLSTEKKSTTASIEQDKSLIQKVETREEAKVAVTVTQVVTKKIGPMVKIPKIVEEPKPVKIIKVEAKAIELIKKKKLSEGTELTDNYLERMTEELNSI